MKFAAAASLTIEGLHVTSRKAEVAAAPPTERQKELTYTLAAYRTERYVQLKLTKHL